MATPEFSEFSYGYALTDSLLRTHFPRLRRAPVFPSLIAEGSSGGGYDLKIPAHPIPLFLQFKIPQVLVRESTLKPKSYSTPYYRMALRTKKPDQHALLLDLETREPLVFYATPLFHSVGELDRYFVRHTVHANSVFISPSLIGTLDNKPHHVAYKPRESIYWLRSEPKPLEGFVIGGNFENAVLKIRSRSPRREARDVLRSTWDWLLERRVAKQRSTQEADIYQFPEDDVRDQARRVAYMAQVHFGITLALLDSDVID